MYDSIQKVISSEVTQYKILADQQLISYRNWIRYLKDDPDFINFFIQLLKDSPHPAFFWEVKPVTEKELDEVFEFVLVKSNSLPDVKADKFTFQKYFIEGEKVVSFANLGGDAQLVVPTPMDTPNYYAHLAAFVRNAPVEQVTSFWQMTAAAYEKQIKEKVVWLSTAGLGVYWLHVRIDSRPKYYRFQAYRNH